MVRWRIRRTSSTADNQGGISHHSAKRWQQVSRIGVRLSISARSGSPNSDSTAISPIVRVGGGEEACAAAGTPAPSTAASTSTEAAARQYGGCACFGQRFELRGNEEVTIGARKGRERAFDRTRRGRTQPAMRRSGGWQPTAGMPRVARRPRLSAPDGTMAGRYRRPAHRRTARYRSAQSGSVKTGARFSRLARTASRWLALPISRACSTDSASSTAAASP